MVAQIVFSGASEALAFSQEIEESLRGVVQNNYVSDPEHGPVGFVTASVGGRYWSETMWMRDAATFLRELTYYGDFVRAKTVWTALIEHLALNEQGYYSFPVYVYPHQPRSGDEMDGLAVWVMSSLALWQRLPTDDAFRTHLFDYLIADASPVRYVLTLLDHAPFVKGTGEFGGGMDDTEHAYYNVVQNGQVAMMLEMLTQTLGANSLDEQCTVFCQECSRAAQRLKHAMLEKMVAEDGSWIWCLETQTNKPAAETILSGLYGAGFTGINGILSHSADVYGLLPVKYQNWFSFPSLSTFHKLLANPTRMRRFSHYGYYAQFDKWYEGSLSSASYGQAYAIQCMLLLDQPELYSKALTYLTNATLDPPYPITRENPYWFYERYLAPDTPAQTLPGWEEGCGALNLVNVTEPLKCARMLVGLDDLGKEILLVPRLPFHWMEARAQDLPIRHPQGGNVLIQLHIQSDGAGRITNVVGDCERPLPSLQIRLGTASRPTWVRTNEDAVHFQESLT